MTATNQRLVVTKFGGTSVANAAQMQKVLAIVQSDPARRIVVVSAPGKRTPDDTKVTDLLIQVANSIVAGLDTSEPRARVLDRFREIQQDLHLPETILEEISQAFAQACATEFADENHLMDVIKACGEDFSARIFAEVLRTNGTPAVYLSPVDAGMLLSDDSGNAQVLPEAYEKLARLRTIQEVVVFPGFFGVSRQGRLVTFSRGGSDITGAILAAATKADLYENWTDVDHVYAADPRSVDRPAPVTSMSFHEMRELSYAGFGVFHDEALIPVVHAQIPVCIKNTNAPDRPGTMLTPQGSASAAVVTGIASTGRFVVINIGKYLMNREVGFTRRLLTILEDLGLTYEHMPSGIDDLSIILEAGQLDPTAEARLLDRIRVELQPDSLDLQRELALVMLVGEGMRTRVGVAATACQALSDAGVNIEMINQGASEISILFGVELADRNKAVQALHDAFLRPDS